MHRRRSGFTLIELLVVMTILLVLSVLVWAVFKPSNTDKMRSAARIAQSAFLGAKDRALHAKELRGVRLIRDPTDVTDAAGNPGADGIADDLFAFAKHGKAAGR
jgi:prepilin-type N-terminal cleavage/methylation domain-containing protein